MPYIIQWITSFIVVQAHGVKHQGVMTPDGIIRFFIGPFFGIEHDATIWRLSGLADLLRDYTKGMKSPGGDQYCWFGDSTYPLTKYLLRPFKGDFCSLFRFAVFFFNDVIKINVLALLSIGRVGRAKGELYAVNSTHMRRVGIWRNWSTLERTDYCSKPETSGGGSGAKYHRRCFPIQSVHMYVWERLLIHSSRVRLGSTFVGWIQAAVWDLTKKKKIISVVTEH